MRDDIVKTLREKLGLNQDQLSHALGLAGKNVVSRWELGERSPNEPIKRLFRYLNELSVNEANAILSRFKKYGADQEGRSKQSK